MNDSTNHPNVELAEMAKRLPPELNHGDGLSHKPAIEESTEQRVDAIEMIGEESAAGYQPADGSEISAGMRYLHCSRTIHQLVGDRNRAVGLYLAVATLLWTASTALLNADPATDLIIPLDKVKKWCLPFTFGTMTVLAAFVALLLVRTRVGLIYEVAKMNALLGLPAERVKRINPLGLFFIQHVLVSLAGGASAALLSVHLLRLAGLEFEHLAWPATLIGAVFFALLIWMYIYAVRATTTDEKLTKAANTLTNTTGT